MKRLKVLIKFSPILLLLFALYIGVGGFSGCNKENTDVENETQKWGRGTDIEENQGFVIRPFDTLWR